MSSPVHEDLTGFSEEEVLGRSHNCRFLNRLRSRDLSQEVRAQLRSAARGERTQRAFPANVLQTGCETLKSLANGLHLNGSKKFLVSTRRVEEEEVVVNNEKGTGPMSQTTWNRHSEDVYMDATHAVSVQGCAEFLHKPPEARKDASFFENMLHLSQGPARSSYSNLGIDVKGRMLIARGRVQVSGDLDSTSPKILGAVRKAREPARNETSVLETKSRSIQASTITHEIFQLGNQTARLLPCSFVPPTLAAEFGCYTPLGAERGFKHIL
ncbi:hypothetical protein AK812_SmicGene29507 [Symbiodinium microadriaticum]|uniref:PAS domain-containing protein n=1 Tax=Symbiodinium microadriaticum TaxID=2951 RepID=A0A1Q9D1P4_SYMMI|nr:hypothetical protein AK812_SmicGene29507 [Symbiodinium microadriaticum]